MSSKKNRMSAAEHGARAFRGKATLSVVAALLGGVAFAVRVGEVGILVSAADALFISSLAFLTSAAFIFIYREGGFDIFIYSFRRLSHRRGEGGQDGYFEFKSRPRASRGALPSLLAIGGSLLLFSVVLSLLQNA